MDLISRELAIPRRYLKATARSDRVIALVHTSWVKSLVQNGSLTDFILSEKIEAWPQHDEDLGKSWNKIVICVYRKRSAKVIPLPRAHSLANINEADLTFSQLLHYVMQTNHKNLWKEAYKKHAAPYSETGARDTHIVLTDYNVILREILIRAYGCRIVNVVEPIASSPHSKQYEPHANMLQVLCAVEAEACFYTLHGPYVAHTLQDCLMFSPAILDTTHTKPLFVIFQLLQALRAMHNRGLTIGDISLADVFVDANLWVQLLPRLDSNLIVRADVDELALSATRLSRISKLRSLPECGKDIHVYENARCVHCSVRCYDKVQITDTTALEHCCQLWVHGQISNLTYISALNRFAGRRYGEPNCHHIFPWVTDFTSRSGNNWRDLTKSKFRLNKGDRQLDLTYDGHLSPTQIPHHVSDVLSSITYYVYMARRTPKSVLCKNVRTVWVPAEYPSSLQRMQEWTPDECIPEFFTKPSVFKSIHEDLPNLEVPPWSSSPEDFVERHREALESGYVSERLHHWIDLTFGYKLSGTAAVKSKNVVLHLVDNHQAMTTSGCSQLFFVPHPTRQTVQSPWCGRLPPKIHFISSKAKRRDPSTCSNASDVRHNDNEEPVVDEELNSPLTTKATLGLSHYLSRSRSSLNEDSARENLITNKMSPTVTAPLQHYVTQQQPPKLQSPKSQKQPTFQSHIQPSSSYQLAAADSERKTSFQSYIVNQRPNNLHGNMPLGHPLTAQRSTPVDGRICLPKEYNPTASLAVIEAFQSFLTKTFHHTLPTTNQNQAADVPWRTRDEPLHVVSLLGSTHLNHTGTMSKSTSSYMSSCDEHDLHNAFTNRIFTENYEAKLARNTTRSTMSKSLDESNIQQQTADVEVRSSGHKQAVASRRIRELQILGCLIVEIFMSRQLRALGGAVTADFGTRLQSCLQVIKACHEALPSCVRYPVQLLLQTDLLPTAECFDKFKYPTVTGIGLPPPSAHQLLQPLVTPSIFAFPPAFWPIYRFLARLQGLSYLSHEYTVRSYFSCAGDNCATFEQLERERMNTKHMLSEGKIKVCSQELEAVLPTLTANASELVDLLVPYIIELIESDATAVLAAWYLFDPLAKSLGPLKTGEKLLAPILKLYEGDVDHYVVHNQKIVKLYHHSFLLRLIVRFGMKRFLDNFVTLLIEAVGGYRDFGRVDMPLHSHILDRRPTLIRKTSNLKYVDEHETTEVLSPTDDDSTADSDKLTVPHAHHSGAETIGGTTSLVDDDQRSHSVLEPEMFTFEAEDKCAALGDEQLAYTKVRDQFGASAAETLSEHGEIETGVAAAEDREADDATRRHLAMSPTIPIPSSCQRTELLSINCEIGSKKSSENDCYEHCVNDGGSDDGGQKHNHYDVGDDDDGADDDDDDEEDVMVVEEDTEGVDSCDYDENTNYYGPRIGRSQPNAPTDSAKISEVSARSLIWLSHRLGPVLTAKYLSRNLLRMLTLCYLGKENMIQVSKEEQSEPLSIVHGRITGDQNAHRVLECLTSIAALYGEQLILSQYLPHITELIVLCKRRMTPNLEGGLISCVVLLKHITPYLSDETLRDHLADGVMKPIIIPCIRLVGTTRTSFPSGAIARAALARKLVDTLYVVMRRCVAHGPRAEMFAPALQRFFLVFDKANGQFTTETEPRPDAPGKDNDSVSSFTRSLEESSYLEVRRDGSTAEWTVRDGQARRVGPDIASSESWSPPPLASADAPSASPRTTIAPADGQRALDELKDVFTCELAHECYLPLVRYLGDTCMDISLKNNALIRELCDAYEQEMQLTYPNLDKLEYLYVLEAKTPPTQTAPQTDAGNDTNSQQDKHILDLIGHKMENSSRHLRGNWLAYWEHEIGRAEKDTKFNFKQIKLQTFQGHVNSVRSLHVLDNENSFMSGSKDKTVKLWSIRSQGNGSAVSQPQWTYNGHKKSVLAITFVESMRLAVSCDSTVHVWDPFMGATLSQLESSARNPPVTALRAMPAPSSMLLAATTEGTVRIIDTKICNYTLEYKLTTMPGSLIRCLAVSPCGRWLAIGHSTGTVTLLDLRFGSKLVASWKAHDGELLQLAVSDSQSLITSSIDQAISVWNVHDGKLKFYLKGAMEPVNCLSCYHNELVSGTTANRIGVHTAIDPNANFSSTRIRSDTLKGVLTSMSILPLNKLLLLGADSGTISLLC